jgi:hypothetical protein
MDFFRGAGLERLARITLPPASLVLAMASKALNSLKVYAWAPMNQPFWRRLSGIGSALRFAASERARTVMRLIGFMVVF